MLTDNQIEMLGDQIAGLYQGYEQDVIADIARRVKKTGRFTETAELQAKSLMDAGESPAVIRKKVMQLLRADEAYQKAVADNTLQYKKTAMEEIKAMEEEAKRQGDEIIANAGDMSYNADLSMWDKAGKTLNKDSGMTNLIAEMQKATRGTLKNLTNTMGFKGAYDFTSVQNAYVKTLDKAVLKMATGTFSFDRAVSDCVSELAHSGLRSVSYDSNGKKRTYQLDTAARLCIRTSCHQLSAQISMHNCDKTDQDLVEVDSHWGARPEHAAWQGKIYSRSGHSKKYPSFSVCRYGAVDGLCGANCRHTFYPFFEGISEPAKWYKEPAPKDYMGKRYSYTDATQKQRQMERNIRATKREIEAQKYIGGDTTVLARKCRAQESEYLSFSEKMDISPKKNRLTVRKGTSNLNTTSMVKSTNQNKSTKSIVTNEKRDTMNIVEQSISSGKVDKKVNLHKQNRHIKASDEYISGRSYINGTIDDAQRIVDNLSGTGEPVYKPNGEWNNKEKVIADKIIGVDVDPVTGSETKTKSATIHYSKTGSHVVPRKDK